MRWRQDVGMVLAPHLTTHDGSVVGAVANGNDGGVIDQVRYLLSVMFVGRGEIDGGQFTLGVNGSMQLEAVVPALPVHPEAGSTFGYLVPVSPYQLTDVQHGAVHESEGCIFHEQLVEYMQHARQCLVALANE